MKRFNDIKNEVCEPVRHYVPDNPTCNTEDLFKQGFMRMYRNFWGAYTDTQIRALNETDYIITGRYCNEPNYMLQVFSSNPIGHNLVVPDAFSNILLNLNLCAKYVKYNGQIAILLSPRVDGPSTLPVLQLSDNDLIHGIIQDIVNCITPCVQN